MGDATPKWNWECRYGEQVFGGLAYCGCSEAFTGGDTFTVPTLPPCKHGNSAFDVRSILTVTTPYGAPAPSD